MNVGTAILTAACFFLDQDQLTLMYVLNTAAAFISGPVPVLLWAMYADVADYSEWKNHRRATGLVFSAATFSQKLGGALGAAVPGWTLALCAFRAPVGGVQQQQSPETISGIIAMMSVIPALFLLAAAGCLLFYNIHDKQLELIEQELADRKKAKPEDYRPI
jgi:GPH family glycoside/pentoside/hexuronide:cation symporter